MSEAPRSRAGWLLFQPISQGAARAVVVLFTLSLAIGALNFAWTSRVVNEANNRIRALCQFDADLGTSPLTLPGKATPSRLGVTIVADARSGWHEIGCPGRLGPPDPSFTRWAAYYKLPAGLSARTGQRLNISQAIAALAAVLGFILYAIKK